MHILEIVSFLPPYGGYFAIEQAAALQSFGHEVRMLYAQQLSVKLDGFMHWGLGHETWVEGLDTKGIEIHKCYFRGMPKMVHWNMERYCSLVGQLFDKYVERYGRPDVLHAHAAKWAGIAAQEISQRTGIPYFVTEHFARGSYEMDFGQNMELHPWAKDAIRKCYKNASCVIPVAEELISDTESLFGRDYRYKAISNVTDVDFYAFRTRSPLINRPFRFCCLAIANGGEFYRKGYDVLLKSVKSLSLPAFELHIAGRATDGEFMKSQIKDMPNVVLHGDLNREQVRELLYQCDALVLASRSEVQPLVVMEALSTGIPIAGTDAIPQCERIDEAVRISSVGDTEGLARCMRQVMDIAPSEAFHEAVVNLSSREVVARRLTELFSEAVPRKG